MAMVGFTWISFRCCAYEAILPIEHFREPRPQQPVFSGVSHPDVDGGHPADICFLTAAPHPGSGGFRNSISLDQFIAGASGLSGVNAEGGVRQHRELQT